MLRAAFASFFVFLAWSPVLSAQDVAITIRLVNGRNGKPVTDENLNVFLSGSGFAENYRADKNGTIRLTVDHNATVSFRLKY